MEKKKKEVAQFFAWVTWSFCPKAFPAIKVNCLQSMGFSIIKKNL